MCVCVFYILDLTHFFYLVLVQQLSLGVESAAQQLLLLDLGM